MWDGVRIWQEALTELESEMRPQSFDTWLRHTSCLECDGSLLTIGVPNVFTGEYLDKKIPHLIEKAFQNLGWGDIRIRYRVAPTAGEEVDAKGTSEKTGFGSEPPQAKTSAVPSWQRDKALSDDLLGPSLHLQPRWTFDTFVPTSGNRLALEACRHLADGSDAPFNPLLIWGGTGLGKTHLLHAIAHEALRRYSSDAILSGEQFMTGMINAIQKGRHEAFRQCLRGASVLLLDDMHILAGKESTQEEFLYTFDAIHEADRRIVLTSVCHPEKISGLKERLRSRFSGGLITELKPLGFSERIAILQAKAEQYELPIPQDVIEYLAEHIQSDVRRLEGALRYATTLSQMQDAPVTVEFAAKAVKAMTGSAG